MLLVKNNYLFFGVKSFQDCSRKYVGFLFDHVENVMEKKIILALLFAFALAVSLNLVHCSKPEKEEAVTKTERAVPYDSLVIALQGVDSINVLELLLLTHEVDYLTTAGGAFVRSIDSVHGTDDFVWIYSVNDTMPNMAADRYVTGGSDTVKWHFRRIRK